MIQKFTKFCVKVHRKKMQNIVLICGQTLRLGQNFVLLEFHIEYVCVCINSLYLMIWVLHCLLPDALDRQLGSLLSLSCKHKWDKKIIKCMENNTCVQWRGLFKDLDHCHGCPCPTTWLCSPVTCLKHQNSWSWWLYPD